MKSNLFARCFVAILLVAGFVWALNSSSSAQSGRKPPPPPSSQNEGQCPKDSEKEKSSYNISRAFSNIAEELRHQYALSYYPSNSKKDGAYRA